MHAISGIIIGVHFLSILTEHTAINYNPQRQRKTSLFFSSFLFPSSCIRPFTPFVTHLCAELALQDVLQGDGVGGELADTLSQLLDGHLVLVEVEAVQGLVADVRLLLDVQRRRGRGVELLGDGLLGVEQLLEQGRGDGQIVAASQLGDLTRVAEGGAHDDGLVAELLVVVVNALDGGHTRVLLLGVLLLGVCLEPVKNTTDEGGDEVGVGLGSSNGLDKGEHKGQVAVNAVVALQDLGSLDTLPCRGDLDQDTLLGDTLLLVELHT